MGNLCSKRAQAKDDDIIIKCSAQDLVKQFLKESCVIWYDPNADSAENNLFKEQIKDVADIITFNNWEEAVKTINQTTQCIYIITSDIYAKDLANEIINLKHVDSI